MLRSAKHLRGYKIAATDGEIGGLHELLFDDQTWTVRYLVADTGGWLAGRMVLLSPVALAEGDWEGKKLHVQLNKQQVEDSPDISTDQPVSRHYELEYYRYYGWPYYWGRAGLWGQGMYPVDLATVDEIQEEASPPDDHVDPHMRSTNEVTQYNIQARDGEIGHVSDFLVDDQTWSIRYMLVDTRNWLPGKHVLVAPEWIEEVNWEDARVRVDLVREAIKNAPEYNPSTQIDSGYEDRLREHYGRPAVR